MESILLPAAHAITPDDHAGIATIAAGTCLVIISLFLIARLILKSPFCGALSGDDYLAIAATALAAVQCLIIIGIVEQGFGKSTRLVEELLLSTTAIQQSLYSAQLCYLAALFLSKGSLLALEHRISQENIHVRIIQMSITFCVAALVASVIMVATGCDLQRPWKAAAFTCASLEQRWTAVGVLGTTLEIAIFGIVTRVLCQLQRTWARNLKGLTIFALRLPLIALTVLRLVAIHQLNLATDPLFYQVMVVCWTQAELSYSLATMTLPCLMPIMSKFDTNLGALDRQTLAASTSSGPYALTQSRSRLRSRIKRNSQHMPLGSEVRLDDLHVQITVQGPEIDDRSIESDGSTKVIVKREVDITYETNTTPGGASRL